MTGSCGHCGGEGWGLDLTLKSGIWYPLRSVIWNTSMELMNAASLVRLCLPLPPTPTSSAFPRGDSRMRLMWQLRGKSRGTWPGSDSPLCRARPTVRGSSVGNVSYIVPKPSLAFLPKWMEVTPAFCFKPKPLVNQWQWRTSSWQPERTGGDADSPLSPHYPAEPESATSPPALGLTYLCF